MSVSGGAVGPEVTRPATPVQVPRPTLSILIRIRGALPSLRPAERRVADAVLADPAKVSESSITAVARQCQTSETTVLRFCRALGLAGYPELRIALARAAQWEENDHAGSSPLTGTISKTDSLADIVAKVSYADARGLEETGAALNLAVLENAVSAVATARRIDIYGSGPSAMVAQDLQLKLHRIGLVSFVWSQSATSLASAGLLTAADAAIGFCHTGTTTDTVAALKAARERGATTIAVTNFGRSPLTEHGDLVLTTAARETTFRSGAMASRIPQLSVADCLFTGVAQRFYDQAQEALAGTVEAEDRRRARSVDSNGRLA